MRTHTYDYKVAIKEFGRMFTDTIYYTANGSTTPYNEDYINNVNYAVDTSLLKSVMQVLTFDSVENLDVGNSIDYGLSIEGVTGSEVRFNNFTITKKEEQKDTNSYKYTCYDNMIKTMVDYTTPIVNSSPITYPISVRDYLNAICTYLGITFKNASDTFTNYNQNVTAEHYLDSDGNGLGYTFRDVLDDLAEVVGGFICIDNLGQLEIRYPSEATEEIPGSSPQTGDTYEFTRDITSGNQYVICSTNSQSANTISSDLSNVVLNSGTPTNNVWIFTAVDGGYTIQNNVTGKYLGYVPNGSTSISLSVNDEPTTWTFDSSNGRTSVSTSGMFARTYYLRYNNGWQLNTSTTYGSLYLVDLGGAPIIQKDTIDEEFFQDTNVNIEKKYGPVNVVVLSRNGADNLYYPSTLPQEPCEIKIENNPILDQTNREDFIQGIYNALNGLEFYLNDFQSTGVTYLEVGDLYNVSINNTTYDCLMLNDNIIRDSGLQENIYTNEPTTSVTDYKYASDTDKLEKTSRNAYFLADKANGTAEMIVTGIGDNGVVSGASVIASINNDSSQVSIDADKINLNGAVTANNNFKINQDGSVEINSGYLDLTDEGSLTTLPRIKITSIYSNNILEISSNALDFNNDNADEHAWYNGTQWSISYEDPDFSGTWHRLTGDGMHGINQESVTSGNTDSWLILSDGGYRSSDGQGNTEKTYIRIHDDNTNIIDLNDSNGTKSFYLDVDSTTINGNTTINGILKSKSISHVETVNLFNKNSYSETGYLNDTGVRSANTSWIISDYIEVTPGEEITISGISYPGVNPAICYYNSSRTYISGTKHNSVGDRTITIPSGCYFIRESINIVYDLDTTQIERGSSATTYSEYQGIGYVSGKNENGSYMKYDDGTLIQWGTKDIGSVAVTTATGNLYVSSSLSSISFPISFIETPVVNMNIHSAGSACFILKVSTPTTQSTGQYFLAYGSSRTISNTIMYFYAIGRWK